MKTSVTFQVGFLKLGYIIAVAGFLMLGSITLYFEEPSFGLFLLVLSSVIFAVSLFMLVPGVICLRLDKEGFEYKCLFIRQRVKWKSVASFQVREVVIPYESYTATYLGITYRAEHIARYGEPSFIQKRFGVGEYIPDLFSVSRKELEFIMNKWLLESRADQTVQPKRRSIFDE